MCAESSALKGMLVEVLPAENTRLGSLLSIGCRCARFPGRRRVLRWGLSVRVPGIGGAENPAWNLHSQTAFLSVAVIRSCPAPGGCLEFAGRSGSPSCSGLA